MNFLEERIMKEGVVKAGNILKVDSFLNHQMDICLLDQMAEGRELNSQLAILKGSLNSVVCSPLTGHCTCRT